MGRTPRYIPENCRLVEITARTLQARYLLRPSRALNEIFVGCLGQAQTLHPAGIVAAVCMSNHCHLLLRVTDTQQMSNFMQHFLGNLSKEVGRLHDWDGPLFGRRYTHVPVSEEEPAQVERLMYLLSQGVKEGQVWHCRDWPGVHFARCFEKDQPLKGRWFWRSKEWSAKQRGETFQRTQYSDLHEIELAHLPCWDDMTPEEYRQEILALIRKIESDYAARWAQEGKEVAGPKAVRRKHPHYRPGSSNRSPAPKVHAATKKARDAFYEALKYFLVEYREASERLRKGELGVPFPDGCFPPALSYVGGELRARAP